MYYSLSKLVLARKASENKNMFTERTYGIESDDEGPADQEDEKDHAELIIETRARFDEIADGLSEDSIAAIGAIISEIESKYDETNLNDPWIAKLNKLKEKVLKPFEAGEADLAEGALADLVSEMRLTIHELNASYCGLTPTRERSELRL